MENAKDFKPDFGGNFERKRPVKSFTLSKEVIEKLNRLQKFHPEINISSWVNNILEIALKEDISPNIFVGYRQKFKPVTLMLRAELADFINALILTGGYGLNSYSRKPVTPLTLGEKVTSVLARTPLFFVGDMTIHGSYETDLLSAKDNTRVMLKNFKYDFEDEEEN